MNRNVWVCTVLNGALLAGTGVARAQEAAPEAPPMIITQAGVLDEGGPGAFGERIELLGFGGLHGGKVVKGAPFSAVAVSETTQTLADGNHITRKTQTNLYRDSQGRFRREVTLPTIGPLTASGLPHSFVEISDAVAGTAYVLEPDQKVARHMPGHMAMRVRTKGGPGGPDDVVYSNFKESTKAIAKTESLGTQTIDGVNAEGARTTRTIPAGEIGNENPITIVSERWYSAELQLVVKSTHSDPRFGDTAYTVTNIQRTEPDASLFTIPADYTVKEGGPGPNVMYRHGFGKEVLPPPPPPAPNE
jgi:hypothetical protein